MNTIARLAVVATISLATLTASTSALASDGEHDHLLLAATGLELDVSTASGSWIATTEGRGSDASDLIELTSADGTLTRLVIGLAEDHNCRGLDRSLARRVAHRVHSADFMTIPGMYPEILATASGRMVFCIDTQRGPLMIAAAASAASAPRYGEFIGVVYRAARTTFGIAGEAPVTDVAPSAPSPAPQPSAAPSPTALPYGYYAPPSYSLVAVSPTAPMPAGYYTGSGYSVAALPVLANNVNYYVPAAMPMSAYTSGTTERLRRLGHLTTPRGFGFGFMGAAALPVSSVGAASGRAVLFFGARIPTAFEFGGRLEIDLGGDQRGFTGSLGASTYIGFHPVALAHHHRFDPSLYVGVGVSAISGMGYTARIESSAALIVPAGVAIDVRLRNSFHLGVFAEIETHAPFECECSAGQQHVFMRASFGLRLLGWTME